MQPHRVHTELFKRAIAKLLSNYNAPDTVNNIMMKKLLSTLLKEGYI